MGFGVRDRGRQRHTRRPVVRRARPAQLRVVDSALLDGFRGAGIGTRLLRSVLEEAAGRRVGVGLEVDLATPSGTCTNGSGSFVGATSEIQRRCAGHRRRRRLS